MTQIQSNILDNRKIELEKNIVTEDEIIFIDTEKKLKYVGLFEIFMFLTLFTFFTAVIFGMFTNYNRDVVNFAIAPTNAYEQKYLDDCKKDYKLYKSLTYETLNVFFVMVSIIFILMSVSVFVNLFRPKEKRRYLIIGIDLIRIFSKEKKVLIASVSLGYPIVLHARTWF